MPIATISGVDVDATYVLLRFRTKGSRATGTDAEIEDARPVEPVALPRRIAAASPGSVKSFRSM